MRRMKGFTLIELLVVIAIIALLVSILLPSLSRARELANRTACKSNVKNIGSALALYKGEYESFPFITNGAGAGYSGTLVAANDNVYALNTSIVDCLNLLVYAGSTGYKMFRCPSVGSEINNPANGKYGFKSGSNIYIDYAYHVGYSTVTGTTANPAAFSENMDGSMIILADKPGSSLAEFKVNESTSTNEGAGYNHVDECINALTASMSATKETKVKSGNYRNNIYTADSISGTTVTCGSAAGAPGFAEDTVLIKGI